jgi:hypothetical protein
MVLVRASVRHCRLRRLLFLHIFSALPYEFPRKAICFPHFLREPSSEGTSEVTVESGGNFEDYIRFLFCHMFGPVNHGQNWKGWERSGEKGFISSDNQAQTCLIITINDTSTGDLPLIITISNTCKNQPKRLDFDSTITLSSLIVSLAPHQEVGNSILCLTSIIVPESVSSFIITDKLR